MIGSIWLSPKGETVEVMAVLDTCISVKDLAGVSWCIPKRQFQGSWRLDSFTRVLFEAGATWKHKKRGRVYEIVLVSNRDSVRAEFGLTINYQEENGPVHACSAASFYRRMAHD